jgi:hypothetical protein
MSNEVNISQLAYGTLDPGFWVEWYVPRPNYDAARKKVAFFTIVPDPVIGGTDIAPVGSSINMDLEITRTWNTVWETGFPDGSIEHVFQRNVRINNTAGEPTAYELLVAETDN